MVAIVILASGCTFSEDEPELSDPTPAQGKGLEVTGFSMTDDHLTPGQQALVRLSLRNYHVKDIDLGEIGLYNTGKITVLESSRGCRSSTIPAAERGINPTVECTWTVEAPPKDELGDFETKTYEPRLRLRYDSQLTNRKDPMQLTFKPGIEINSTETVSRTYSNGEVQMTVEADSPIPIEANGNLDIEIKPTESGSVISEPSPGYQTEVSPSEIIENCGGENVAESGNIASFDMPFEIDKRTSISCQLSSSSTSQTQRNIIISTSYKYQQSPHLNIEVRSNNG